MVLQTEKRSLFQTTAREDLTKVLSRFSRFISPIQPRLRLNRGLMGNDDGERLYGVPDTGVPRRDRRSMEDPGRRVMHVSVYAHVTRHFGIRPFLRSFVRSHSFLSFLGLFGAP